jgi:DNA-binding transcriptional ArsR family regulator
MTDKFLLFDLEDEKSKKLGEVISNPTCKKIINLISEKEVSESDLAKELKIPINTIEYNLKKLLEAGIIEKKKEFFWSRKGKKIDLYQLANKLIIISPKKSLSSKIKSILPAVIITGLVTSAIAIYSRVTEESINDLQTPASVEMAKLGANTANFISADYGGAARSIESTLFSQFQNWEWFLIGGLVVLASFLVWNWKKL